MKTINWAQWHRPGILAFINRGYTVEFKASPRIHKTVSKILIITNSSNNVSKRNRIAVVGTSGWRAKRKNLFFLTT